MLLEGKLFPSHIATHLTTSMGWMGGWMDTRKLIHFKLFHTAFVNILKFYDEQAHSVQEMRGLGRGIGSYESAQPSR